MQRTNFKYTKLHDTKFGIGLAGIASYRGMAGNETADRIANEATVNPLNRNSIPIPREDIMGCAIEVIHEEWNRI